MKKQLLIAVLFAAVSAAAQAQPAPPVWTGSVRCEVEVAGAGYINKQTHTWTLTGAIAPGGGALDYPGTWSVSGEGSTGAATWKINGSMSGVRMAIFVRPADQKLVVFLRHGPLTAPEAMAVVRQPSTRSVMPVSEYRPFPTIVDDGKSTHVTGSIATPVTARLDTLQPPASLGKADCKWDLVQSGAAPIAIGAAAPKNTPVPAATPPRNPTAPAAAPVASTRAPDPPVETTPTMTKATLSGCAAADARVVTVTRGQSQTVTASLKTSRAIDWLTLRFAPGTSVHATLNNSAPMADASDFQLQAFSDCSTMIVMTTGTGEKTLDFPDSGPHSVLVRIVTNQWKAASPAYTLKLEGR